MKRSMLASLLLVNAGIGQAPVAASEKVAFEPLARRCAASVNTTTMAAVVWHESHFNSLAIGLNHTKARLPRQPQSVSEAVATAEWLDQNGYNFDSGLGQLNSRNRAHLGMSYADLFDPCANLQGASRILTDCFQSASATGRIGQAALHAALSCYATGNFQRGINNGYVSDLAAHVRVASNQPVVKVPALVNGPVHDPMPPPAGNTGGTGPVPQAPAEQPRPRCMSADEVGTSIFGGPSQPHGPGCEGSDDDSDDAQCATADEKAASTFGGASPTEHGTCSKKTARDPKSDRS